LGGQRRALLHRRARLRRRTTGRLTEIEANDASGNPSSILSGALAALVRIQRESNIQPSSFASQADIRMFAAVTHSGDSGFMLSKGKLLYRGFPFCMDFQSTGGDQAMNLILFKLYIKIHELADREDGQDLVEYAMLVALIAFGAAAGMKTLSNALNLAFSNISSRLGTYTT
jgi:pilus assembly protein Flp/PilA